MKKNKKTTLIIIILILFTSGLFSFYQLSRNTVITKRAVTLDKNKTENPSEDEDNEEIKPISIPSAEQYTQPIQPIQPKEPEYISQTEEVYWNIWKSNLFNRFIKDVNDEGQVPPTFRAHLEFDVTKNREIINCYLGVDPPDFQEAFQTSIIRILKSYQHTDILTFPEKTQRSTKHVRFILRPNFENSNPYKTPDDFNKDTEYIQTRRLKM